jgi:hypothetical protein
MKAYLPRIASCMALFMLPIVFAADVDTPHYRVEVIVFTHVEGRSDARDMDTFQDFSALTDPLIRARRAAMPPAVERTDLHIAGDRDDETPYDPEIDDAASEQTRQAELEAVLQLIDTLADLEEGALMPDLPVWPEPYLALEQLSPKMEHALARLEGSPGHQVLSWRAWHQPLESGSAGERVRIHDDHPIAANWLELAPTGAIVSTENDGQDSPGLEPVFHYRLDGGVRLRQRQFMHLESELHWRARRETSPWTTAIEIHDQATGDYQVHRLQQSRTVRPGRLEYFDSSWLGMLVLIEPIAPLDGSDVDPDDAFTDVD